MQAQATKSSRFNFQWFTKAVKESDRSSDVESGKNTKIIETVSPAFETQNNKSGFRRQIKNLASRVKAQLKDRPLQTSLILLLVVALLVVLGGLLIKFVPAVKGMTYIAATIQKFPQLMAWNGYAMPIAGSSAAALTGLGLILDSFNHKIKNLEKAINDTVASSSGEEYKNLNSRSENESPGEEK